MTVWQRVQLPRRVDQVVDCVMARYVDDLPGGVAVRSSEHALTLVSSNHMLEEVKPFLIVHFSLKPRSKT